MTLRRLSLDPVPPILAAGEEVDKVLAAGDRIIVHFACDGQPYAYPT